MGESLAQVLRAGPVGAHRLPGSRLGPFVVSAELARGGMGVVFDATHEPSGERVALKVLLAGDAATTQQRKRFVRESAATAELKSPGIVGVIDSGEIDGLLFLALEFIEGTTLEAEFSRGLGAEELTATLLQVADALAPAHAAGIVHRDLKPANVLIRASDRRALVADFGLVRYTDMASSLTRAGAMVGTPTYMAPEQILSKPCTAATDVFALGVMLFEGLTGALPFEGTNPAIRLGYIAAGPQLPSAIEPGVSRALDRVCLRALSNEPSERYPDAAVFAQTLRETLTAPERPAAGVAAKVGVLAGILTLVVGGSFAAFYGSDRERVSAPPPKRTPRVRRPRPAPKEPRLWGLSRGDTFTLLYKLKEHDSKTAVWFNWEFDARVEVEDGPSVVVRCVARSVQGAYGANLLGGGGGSFDSRRPDPNHPLAILGSAVGRVLTYRLDRRDGAVSKLRGMRAIGEDILAADTFTNSTGSTRFSMRRYVALAFANTYLRRAFDCVFCTAAGGERPNWRRASGGKKWFLSQPSGEAAIGPLTESWKLEPTLRFRLDGASTFDARGLKTGHVTQTLLGRLKDDVVVPLRSGVTSEISWSLEIKDANRD